MRRDLRYRLEADLLEAVFGLFRLLPIDAASWLGGWLGRTIGPRTRAHRTASRNLASAMPELSETEVHTTLMAMWDNLGRVTGEYPHLDELLAGGARTELVGAEHLHAAAVAGVPVAFFSGHFGNWEILSSAPSRNGIETVQIYRAANNPFADRVIEQMRRPVGGRRVRKGARGAREMLAAIRGGQSLALLMDQKMNDGIPATFFGRPAMTSTGLVDAALRYDMPVIAARVERLGGAHFRVVIEPPVKLTRSGDRQADIAAGVAWINQKLEGWIRSAPGLWFWVHQRWAD